MNKEIYEWLNGYSVFLILWLALSTAVTLARIGLRFSRSAAPAKHSSFFAELAALPLALLQSACFIKSILARDAASALLFLWWGPGFVATAAYLLACVIRKRKPNFFPFRQTISWLCKLNYLAFMVVFYSFSLPALMYIYSAWIISDQISMAFLSLDADRLRRTFDDYWAVRVCYPLGLLLPFFVPAMPHVTACRIYGAVLLASWAAGIAYVARQGKLLQYPNSSALLRNLVYFSAPK